MSDIDVSKIVLGLTNLSVKRRPATCMDRKRNNIILYIYDVCDVYTSCYIFKFIFLLSIEN